MIIFYSDKISSSTLTLTLEESAHCVRVLRHRAGDEIRVIDGLGNMYECRLANADPKAATAVIEQVHRNWNAHPYHLTMAVCPTKNSERMEWFVEKAVELGVDEIVPLIAERSERRQFRTDRLEKIALSATKQSLKAKLPKLRSAVPVRQFLEEGTGGLKMIACCYDGPDYPRRSIVEALNTCTVSLPAATLQNHPACASLQGQPGSASGREITILIGPEGDFSGTELVAALGAGYIPVHIGPSRLRTETAALMGVATVYAAFID